MGEGGGRWFLWVILQFLHGGIWHEVHLTGKVWLINQSIDEWKVQKQHAIESKRAKHTEMCWAEGQDRNVLSYIDLSSSCPTQTHSLSHLWFVGIIWKHLKTPKNRFKVKTHTGVFRYITGPASSHDVWEWLIYPISHINWLHLKMWTFNMLLSLGN